MPRAGLNPSVIVREAADIVDEVGHGQLTLAALAAHFGVAVPSLYKHVDGIDDVRRRLSIRAVEELRTSLEQATRGRGGSDAFRAMADAYRAYARRHPGRYAATVRAPAAEDAEHRAAADAVLGTVLGVLGDYDVTGDDAIDAARIVRSALHGFTALEHAGGFGLPRDVERSYTRLVDALEAGLEAM